MPPPPQSYSNHAHRPVLTSVAGGFAIAALAFFILGIRQMPPALALGLVCLLVSVMSLVWISRVYTVRLQDRIIRLEMRLRLARLGREADYDRLSTPQLVGLRFASDAEIPALVDRALAERLTSKQIKEAVRNWQPDYHRT